MQERGRMIIKIKTNKILQQEIIPTFIFILIIQCVISTLVLFVNRNQLLSDVYKKNQEIILLKDNIKKSDNKINQLTLNNQSLKCQVIELQSTLESTKKELKETLLTHESQLNSLESENQELRKYANTYNSDLDLLSRILYAEAGNSTDEDMLLVGTVIFNRIAHKDFPNTLRKVVYQKGQYSPTWNGAINKTPSERAIKNAKRLLAGERFAPKNVVYQAQFKQGNGVWKMVGNHYYCYG